jgi:hypothetical protein
MKKMFLIAVCFPALLNAQTQQKQALFLTTATPTAGDVAVSNRLAQLGFAVTRLTDTVSQTSDANGKDLIVVSSSVGSGNITTKFTASPVPLINAEQAIYDDLGIDANNAGGATVANQTQVDVVDCTHPLAGGLTNGLNTVYTAAGPLVALATPVASAQIVARAADGRSSVFFIEAGAELNPVRIATAPARRVGIFLEATMFMTQAGLDLFDAAVAWAIADPGSTAPAGITQQPGSLSVNEQTFVSFKVGYTGAPPFTVQWQRSDAGGPFADIIGANCPTYGLGPATPPDNGARFQAIVGNAAGTVTSSAATLTVNTDTTAPRLVLAIGGGTPPTAFDAVFSEPVDPASAGDPVNYALGNGAAILTATIDPDGRTVHFTSDPITNGTVLSTTVPISDLAFTPNVLNPGDPGSSIAIITTDGSIRRHQFNGFGGVLVSDLTNNAKFPNSPDVIDFPTLFETAVNAADNYGVQFLGYVAAPVSGNYHFYMSSDDGGALYLSTDESPANKRLIAFEPVWADSRIWTGNSGGGRNLAAPQNQSRTLFPNGIPLVQGQRYYIEALMKEQTGGDNLGVAWQRPGDPIPANGSSPIPGLYLSRYDVPAAVAAGEPADQTVFEARQATFGITPSGSPPLTIQWYENDVAIPGATGPTYTTPVLTTADSGKLYYAVVDNPFSSVTSRVARLTVNADNAPPVLVSAASVSGTDIGLCFDEGLDAATAGNPANYTVNGGAIAVTSAVLRHDQRTVLLSLGGPVSDGFTVRVNNVLDLTGRNAAAGTTASGPVAGLTPTDVGTVGDPAAVGSTFSCKTNEFEIIAGGSDIWGNADHGHIAFETVTGNFDKKVLLARIDNTDPSAKAGLMARESTAADSRNLHSFVMPPPPARNIFETGMRAATAGGTAGWGTAGGANGNLPATHPNSWLRLRRVGDTFSSFVSTNGVDWVQNGESVQSYPAEVIVGLAASAHNNDGRTNRVLFRSFTDTTFPGAVVTITQNPVNFTGEENHPATFTAEATVSGAPASELQFQWQRGDGAGGFTDILGATGSNFTFAATLADNGAQFRAVAFVPGASATSTAATLTVTNDITRPRIVRATISCADQTQVTVVYSELYNPDTAQDIVNYGLADNTGTQIPISNLSTQANGTTVILIAQTPLTGAASYVVTVNSVSDIAGNLIEPNTTVTLGNEGARMAVGPQNLIVVEAENFDANVPQGGKSWVFSSRPGGVGPISGSGYMQALPDSGAAINEPGHVTQSPRLDYCINFPVAGRWYVWVRGNDIATGGNSAHVGIDNTDSTDLNDNRIGNSGGATGWGNPAGASSPWQWTRDADVNTRIAWVTVPSPGLHTFNIWMREDSVVVDKFLLTTDAAFVISPNTAVGPAESPREGGGPATLSISRAAGDVILTWDNPSAVLESADEITGSWAPVTGATSGYRVAAGGARRFYRAVVP